MICTFCNINEVTSDRPDTDFCRMCFYAGRHIERTIGPWLDMLRQRADAYIDWLGGGLMCLHIPAGEDRWVWFGWGDSGEDALHAQDRWPYVGEYVSGCVYLRPDGERFAMLGDHLIHDNTPEGLTRLVLDNMTAAAMAMSPDEMEWA